MVEGFWRVRHLDLCHEEVGKHLQTSESGLESGQEASKNITLAPNPRWWIEAFSRAAAEAHLQLETSTRQDITYTEANRQEHLKSKDEL